jgi:hypothetical protein
MMTVKFLTKNELSVFEIITGTQPSKEDGSDRIKQVKTFVEGLDVDAALQSARDCSDARGLSVFILGGILKAIRDNEWFKEHG